MTLKIEYTHICDTCCATMDTQTYVIGALGEIPRPKNQFIVNGHMLCKDCAEIAVAALNEALDSRRKKEPTDG
jgi:hypothetical protein